MLSHAEYSRHRNCAADFYVRADSQREGDGLPVRLLQIPPNGSRIQASREEQRVGPPHRRVAPHGSRQGLIEDVEVVREREIEVTIRQRWSIVADLLRASIGFPEKEVARSEASHPGEQALAIEEPIRQQDPHEPTRVEDGAEMRMACERFGAGADEQHTGTLVVVDRKEPEAIRADQQTSPAVDAGGVVAIEAGRGRLQRGRAPELAQSGRREPLASGGDDLAHDETGAVSVGDMRDGSARGGGPRRVEISRADRAGDEIGKEGQPRPDRLDERSSAVRVFVDTEDEVGHAVSPSGRPRQVSREGAVGVGDIRYVEPSRAARVRSRNAARLAKKGRNRTRGRPGPRVLLVADSRAYATVTAPPPRARACPARACSPCGRGTRDSAATGGGT